MLGGHGALAAAGVEKFRRAWPLVPEESVASLRDDIREVADRSGPTDRL